MAYMEYAKANNARIELLIKVNKLNLEESFLKSIISAAAVKLYTGSTAKVESRSTKLKAEVSVSI